MKQQILNLLGTLRESSNTTIWSKAVILSREKKVLFVKQNDQEYTFQVANLQTSISQVVHLYLEDEDWSCNCNSALAACEHAIAATITLKQSFDNNETLVSVVQQSACIKYRFKTENNQVHFHRTLSDMSGEKPLNYAVTPIISGRTTGPQISATQLDLTIEHVLKNNLSGSLTPLVWLDLSTYLSQVDDLQLDHQPVNFSKDKIGFEAIVRDEINGVTLQIISHRDIQHFYSNGLARCGETLKVVSRQGLDAQIIQKYSEKQYFSPKQFNELVSQIIPDIKKHIPVAIESRNLPQQISILPYLAIETVQSEKCLYSTPVLIYGDPEVARVVGEHLVVKDDKVVPVRNWTIEQKLKEQLLKDWPESKIGQTQVYKNSHAVLQTQALSKWKGEVRGHGLQQFSEKLIHQQPRLEYADEQLTLAFENLSNHSQIHQASVNDLIHYWQTNESHFPLLDGGWAPLPKDWLKQFGHTLLELVAAKENNPINKKSQQHLVLDLFAKVGQEAPAELKNFKEEFLKWQSQSTPQLPADLNASLREYQIEGVNWLQNLQNIEMGALLADDMGLGKTLQSICILKGKCLIIAPVSVLGNWQREIQRFRPSLKTQIYHGAARKLNENVDIILTTYALLRLDLDLFASTTWDVIVLDEAHNIKNPQSKASLAVFQMQAKFRLCLTGTPIENKLEELWSQFNFINGGLLGSLDFFKKNYILSDDPQGAQEKLRHRVKPFILRRKKTEVAKELPPKTETILECELSQYEADLYHTLLNSQRQEVLKLLSEGGNIMQALELLLRLRQVCCSPALLPQSNNTTISPSSKIDTLMESLESIIESDSKVLIFSQWTSFLDLIERNLEQAELRYLRLDGQTKNRQLIVDQFQTESQNKILLLSLKAGGVGLNLTAADQVFIMDPWWNPFVEDQAADRAYRIGQDKPVFVKKIVAKGTIEEKILLLQEQKRNLSATILEGTQSTAQMTKEDLLFLLSE